MLRPADYYSGPSPQAVLPRGVTFGCGAASVLALILIALGGAWMASGGIVDVMDMAFGMSMGEVRGMIASDVSAADKKALEDAVEAMRGRLRNGAMPVAALNPVMETMRKGISDKKMTVEEVHALTAAARKAAAVPVPKKPK
ncbi:MAG TPA: hypothetical protein VM733_05325 [Thermoanaerobaculia bacterium]|nr:hypothetical protein [Thermoanaerobaculia bacterium]